MSTFIKTTFLNTATPGTGAPVQDFEVSPFLTHFLGTGILPHADYPAGAVVIPSDPVGLSVVVQPRSFAIGVSRVPNPAPFNSFKAMVQVQAPQTVVIPANNSGNTQLGALVLRLQSSSVQNGATLSGSGLGETTLQFVPGTSALPLTDGEVSTAIAGDFFIRLANIQLLDGQTSINTADITVIVKEATIQPSATGININGGTGVATASDAALPRVHNMPWGRVAGDAVPYDQVADMIGGTGAGPMMALHYDMLGGMSINLPMFLPDMEYLVNVYSYNYTIRLRVWNTSTKVLQNVTLPQDYIQAQVCRGIAVIGNYLYALFAGPASTPDAKLLRFDIDDIAAGGTVMTGLPSSFVTVYMNLYCDGEYLYIHYDGGQSSSVATTLRKYSISGTALTAQTSLNLASSGLTNNSFASALAMDDQYIYFVDSAAETFNKYNRDTDTIEYSFWMDRINTSTGKPPYMTMIGKDPYIIYTDEVTRLTQLQSITF